MAKKTFLSNCLFVLNPNNAETEIDLPKPFRSKAICKSRERKKILDKKPVSMARFSQFWTNV